ncbi:MAG: cryptochrome/photolyase family protein [Anaerolineales bacterium]|nr:cryptochrome/photolyase family protein [Anaerolineales bacterium]
MPPRTTVWILGDQLLKIHPAIQKAEEEHPRSSIQVLLIENRARISRLPYHRKKIVLLLSAMRHYAVELKNQGYEVDYIQAPSLQAGLARHFQAWNPERIYTMAASERRGREFQQQTLAKRTDAAVDVLPNTQFLVGRFNPIPEPEPEKSYVMENFYRAMRRHFGLLMDGGNPAGGQWNYDKENRKRLPRDVRIPEPPRFSPDQITTTVIDEVRELKAATGSLQDFALAVTGSDANLAFDDFVKNRLPEFGPFEDAMSSTSGTLFHSILSPYLNLGLLDPLDLAMQAEEAYLNDQAPINSAEGFIRQIIGWREYMYWQYWRMGPEYRELNFWKASRPLPAWFWDGGTRMKCLAQALKRIQNTGYAHHIERLMLLSNFSLLAGLDPGEVNDWFLSHFIDAYEWVMEPNVIGMGLHADGGLTATKPYIASANYINKMSDYCKGCEYNHRQRTGEGACPFNALYWNFLLENEQTLRNNPRMGPNVLGLRHLEDEERILIRSEAQEFLSGLI